MATRDGVSILNKGAGEGLPVEQTGMQCLGKTGVAVGLTKAIKIDDNAEHFDSDRSFKRISSCENAS